MIFTIPNLITYTRIGMIPLIAMCLYSPDDITWRFIAFCLFALSGITDFLDGFLARYLNSHSALGKMLDPIADKLLVCVVLVMLVAVDDVRGLHVVAALIILCREFLVSGLREYLAATAMSLPVSLLAKWKTTMQILALGFLVIGKASIWVNPDIPAHFIGLCLLWVAALLTLYTGYDYLRSGIAHALDTPSSSSQSS